MTESSELIKVYSCAACDNFEAVEVEMLVLHQCECEMLPEEKREFRRFVALLTFGDNLGQAVAIYHNYLELYRANQAAEAEAEHGHA